ncbi:hypothetical protein P886_3810 [Alteromonadaceae bacterium 2753L.S.0a.02]|nr:hypothetical protein P886_3810 [Alteromonadaceae bacterium 2753L.S.0a.02]
MKIRLVKTPLKTAIEIDALNPIDSDRFYSNLSVVVFHMGAEINDTAPVVAASFCGRLDASDAQKYAKGLKLAGLLCEHSREHTVYKTFSDIAAKKLSCAATVVGGIH